MNCPKIERLVYDETMVFLVDDDPDVRRSLALLFESVGLACCSFASGPEFLDAYEPIQPGCLVLDVRMPRMSGTEVHRELERRNCGLPVIFVTGYGDVPMVVEAMKRGAITFLQKPVRPQELVDWVHEALKRDHQTRLAAKERKVIETLLADLTEREQEVLDRLVAGETIKETALALGLSPKTVDFHCQKVLDKMKARNQVDLIRRIISARAAAPPFARQMSACS